MFFLQANNNVLTKISWRNTPLKVPKGESFDRLDFYDFYIIKSLWLGGGDFVR